jgi:hypothetical protein
MAEENMNAMERFVSYPIRHAPSSIVAAAGGMYAGAFGTLLVLSYSGVAKDASDLVWVLPAMSLGTMAGEIAALGAHYAGRIVGRRLSHQ